TGVQTCALPIYPAERGAGGRPLLHRPPGQGVSSGPPAGGAAEGADSPSNVRGARSGGHRQPGDRPGDDQGDAEKRPGQMLRRRCKREAEAVGETKGRKETDEGRRQRGGAPGSLHGGVEAGRLRQEMRHAPAAEGGKEGSRCPLKRSIFTSPFAPTNAITATSPPTW